MDLQTVIETDQTYYLNTFGNRTPVNFVAGQGVYLESSDGKQYLDMLAGIAVNILGYANAHLTEAICEQAGKLLHCSNLYYIESQAELAKCLAEQSGMERAFICNSGGEANEAAIKLVRGYFHKNDNKRVHIYSARNSFHGRTLATVTATGQPKYSLPFAPLPPGFSYLPFNDIAALEEAIQRPDTAAVLLELVQGESGVHPVSIEYARAAEQLCREHGVMLMVDEIQTGMGRTGHFLSTQTYGIQADVVTMAKGLAGGVPVGALLARGKVCQGFEPGQHGTTFGGNPLACTAALATLDEYKRLQLAQNATVQGSYLLQQLKALQDRQPEKITETRGLGLMVAFDLAEDGPSGQEIRDRLFAEQVLVNATGPHTIRLLPPLIIRQEDIDKFIEILEQVL